MFIVHHNLVFESSAISEKNDIFIDQHVDEVIQPFIDELSECLG